MYRTKRLLPLLVLLLVPFTVSPAAAQARRASDGWVRSSPAAEGLDTARLRLALSHADRMPELRSLLVARKGKLVVERYYHGATRETAFNVKSVSKSFLSALLGVSLGEGLLASLDQPALAFFPEYARREVDPRKREITLRHLVSMTSGLESTSFGSSYGRWVNSRDWVRYVLEREMTAPPGTRFDYSTGSTHLLSAVLTHATGVSTRALMQRHLLDPLGIRIAGWARDPQGIYVGGNDMRFRARDLLRFGQLYLDGGRYGGRQVVPAEWVRASWEPVGRSRWSGHRYGYGWWIERFAGYDTYFAWGHGGQYIFVVPALELVVAVTSSQRGGQKEPVYGLLEEHLLPAVR